MSHSMKSAVIPHTNQNLMLKDKFRSVKLSTALGLFASPQLFPPHLASGRYLSNSITSSFHIYNNNIENRDLRRPKSTSKFTIK